MTSLISRILPGPKTKSSPRLDAARAELDRRKSERAKAEKAKAAALGAEREKLEAARIQFEASGSSEDAERVVVAEGVLAKLEELHSRTLSRLSDAIAAHERLVKEAEGDSEAEGLVATFSARHDALLALPGLLERIAKQLPALPVLPETTPEVQALARTKLDSLSADAKRAVELTNFAGLGALELGPRKAELLALAEKLMSAGRTLGAIANASEDLSLLDANIKRQEAERARFPLQAAG